MLGIGTCFNYTLYIGKTILPSNRQAPVFNGHNCSETAVKKKWRLKMDYVNKFI